MTTYLFIRRTVILTSLTLIAWLPALAAQPGDQPSRGATLPASTEAMSAVAAGAAEDTLKACMARIPQDASIGQRMIAETSCQREEMDRKVIQAVPNTEYASQ
jgi:hypothetical protein